MEKEITQKLISIIIPCYNVEKYIHRCFDSIARQTIGLEKLEVILVDDCSTDSTWEKLMAIEAGHPESVMIIHCDENGHQGTARNIGLSYASAPFIGFIDSDDWIEADMYEKLYAKMKSFCCDIVMCRQWRDSAIPGQTTVSRETGEESRLFVIDTTDKRKTFLLCASLGYSACDKLYTREFLTGNNILFPEGLAYEDHYFTTLLYLYAQRVYRIEERMYHYFINPSSTVLSFDVPYHFDILTVNKMLWKECLIRGFMELYLSEMEYQFLSLCYFAAMKIICLRFTEIPYGFFLNLRKETLLRIPDYHANPYVEEYTTELNKTLLGTLDYEISKQDLTALCAAMRKIYLKNTITVYVMTHVAFDIPNDSVYMPLHVGRTLHDDLGYPGDDTGDNISALNPYYSELTGLYWAWKNIHNTAYIGLCHYRRYFLIDERHLMTKRDYLDILSHYDVMLSNPIHSDKCYREVYAEAHNLADLEAVGNAISTLYPDCFPIFEETLSGNTLYCGNLFATTKQLFDDYAQWLFSIFELASKQIDVSTYDDYHKRVYGFLSEQLLYVWIRYRNLSYYEAKIGFTQEKAETISLKAKLDRLMAEDKIDEAYDTIINTLKKRPDLTLPASDFGQELNRTIQEIAKKRTFGSLSKEFPIK